MDVTQSEQNVNYSSAAYFENLFEVWKNILDTPEAINPENISALFSKELVLGNLTPAQERDCLTIIDFIGDLYYMKLMDAIPPFLSKLQSQVLLSRSRNGFQQETFTTQTMKHNYEDKGQKKRALTFWRQ
jgi:hypothetical protein